jgi:hypothetical protein
VAFFRGTSLRPVPPGESKHKEVRYVYIREDDQIDEAQMATWIRQAAACQAGSRKFWSENDGSQDVQEVGEGRKEGRRHAQVRVADD